MDEFTKRLQADAERIEVGISDELERRIEASLHASEVLRPEDHSTSSRQTAARPALFWWASSTTGIAAALLLIALANGPARQVDEVSDAVPAAVVASLDAPAIDLKVESAMLTEPLRQELEDLQSDLKKVEQRVREDIGL